MTCAIRNSPHRGLFHTCCYGIRFFTSLRVGTFLFVNALFVHVAVTYEPTTGFAPGRNCARGASAKTGIQGLQA